MLGESLRLLTGSLEERSNLGPPSLSLFGNTLREAFADLKSLDITRSDISSIGSIFVEQGKALLEFWGDALQYFKAEYQVGKVIAEEATTEDYWYGRRHKLIIPNGEMKARFGVSPPTGILLAVIEILEKDKRGVFTASYDTSKRTMVEEMQWISRREISNPHIYFSESTNGETWIANYEIKFNIGRLELIGRRWFPAHLSGTKIIRVPFNYQTVEPYFSFRDLIEFNWIDFDSDKV